MGYCAAASFFCAKGGWTLISESTSIRSKWDRYSRSRYLRNFSNEKIDTKIFTAKNFLKSILSAVIGIIGSFLLDRMNISYCMLIIGASTIILTILLSQYMKTRVGLKPQEYSKEEIKYDELKNK